MILIDNTVLSNFSLIHRHEVLRDAFCDGIGTTEQVFHELERGIQLGRLPDCQWGAVSELKGRMLEFIVHRELNQCKKRGKPVKKFRQRLRTVPVQKHAERMEDMLAACCESRFDTVWMNYYIKLPGSLVGELDILAEGTDAEGVHALVFEVKNRDEKKPPSMREAKSFVTKVEMLRQRIVQEEKRIRFVCPVCLSAKGFENDVETWLHEHGVLTADMETWDV